MNKKLPAPMKKISLDEFKKQYPNVDDFDKQVIPQIGLTVQKNTEAKGKEFNKEQELFYRATDYRGS